MDRRGWPWKKKSSEKVTANTVTANTDSTNASLASSAENRGDEGNSKNAKFVQITEESYAHLIELEDQVKILNEKLSLANEKLSSALLENTTKDDLVKQHTKVAEEAVSGWEKAEAEALTLKNQLESVTLLKLTAEDRAAHLDGALKECMRQIRNVKEESEQKLHDVIFAKTKQWEKVKAELEAKIVDMDQELLRASADNNALSRSLQERSNLLMRISEEKSQADAQIELLKDDIQSCDREINSLKYEHHIVSKELEIRNEEKNMSLRSAEVANKQHLEGVKKIAKLEAECQRLRGLVRKKLPGPAALAQMKLEVESLGRDYGEPRMRRSPVKNSSPHSAPPAEFTLESVHQNNKETEFLTARLLSTEEETKMLKEALSKRNSELQSSRNMCAKTASKLRSLEAQLQILNQQRSPSKPNMEILTEGSLNHNASNPPSLTSMSEDGCDDEASCADSWATALISELSQFKKEKNIENVSKTENSNHRELMDDFLEMEKLACLSTQSNGTISVSDHNTTDKKSEIANPQLSDAAKDQGNQDESSAAGSDKTRVTLKKLESTVALIFESQAKDLDICKLLEDIKKVAQDVQETLPHHSVSCIFEESEKRPAEDIGESTDSTVSLFCDNKPCIELNKPMDQGLEKAISGIHDFVGLLLKEVKEIQERGLNDHGLTVKIQEFSNSVDKVLSSEMGLVDFIHDLSCVLSEASKMSISVLGVKGIEGDSNNSDCIDKVALLENKVIYPEHSKDRCSSDSNLVSNSTCDPEMLHDGSSVPSFELKTECCKCSQEEIEQLKLERNSMAMDLARCNENLEQQRVQLEETEQLISQLNLEIASCQKSNSLAETQLKCMAESYKSLETRAEDLETDRDLLREKADRLEIELQEEKQNHEDALTKCKDLQAKCNDLEDQIQRTEKCSMCSPSSAADADKIKQERDIAAAAEKLAECQETIFLLGKQLKALRSPTDPMDPSYEERFKIGDDFQENESSRRRLKMQGLGTEDFDQAEMENMPSNMNRIGGESPLNVFNSPMSPSDAELSPTTRSPINSKRQKHRSTGSGSSSSSMVTSAEKHGRGFSRFFSKGKGVH